MPPGPPPLRCQPEGLGPELARGLTPLRRRPTRHPAVGGLRHPGRHGTGTPEVGGFTSFEAQELIRGLAGLDVVGCDVVEVAPQFDGPGQITALLAANLMFELLCVIARK